MPTAKKLPSGSWRCLVYDYTDQNGKRIYRSFTSSNPDREGKREAELMAAQYMSMRQETRKQTTNMTVQEAIKAYIESKKNTLSQTTIRGYLSLEKNMFEEIRNTPIKKLTNATLQAWIGNISINRKPKTVKNAYGLLTASLEMFLPSANFKVKLPQKIKPQLYIPTDADIKAVIDYFEKNDHDMLIAVYLAAFGTLRRSEICALTAADVTGNIIHINKAMVKTPECKWIIKTTKNITSTRDVEMPQFVIDALPKKGPLVTINPNTVSHRFESRLKKLDVPKFRFHDLRHYSASIMHAIGVPDVYIMQRGGWASDATLKQIYRGSIDDFTKKYTEQTLSHFDDMQHEMQHK